MTHKVSVEKYDLSITEPPFLTNKVGEFTYTDEEYKWASDTFGADCAHSAVFRPKVADMGYWMQFFTSGKGDHKFKVVVWDSAADYYAHIRNEAFI
jgi:hypothetical protein